MDGRDSHSDVSGYSIESPMVTGSDDVSPLSPGSPTFSPAPRRRNMMGSVIGASKRSLVSALVESPLLSPDSPHNSNEACSPKHFNIVKSNLQNILPVVSDDHAANSHTPNTTGKAAGSGKISDTVSFFERGGVCPKCKEWEVSGDIVKNQLAHANAENDRLTLEISRLEHILQQLEHVKTERDTMEEDLLQEQKAHFIDLDLLLEAESTISRLNSEIETMRDEVVDLKEQLDMNENYSNKKLETSEMLCQQLQGSVTELTDKLKLERETHAVDVESLKKLQKMYVNSESEECEKLQKDLKKLHVELAMEKESHRCDLSAAEKLQGYVSQLKIELVKEKEAHSSDLAAAEDIIQDVVNSDASKLECDALKKELEALRIEYRNAQKLHAADLEDSCKLRRLARLAFAETAATAAAFAREPVVTLQQAVTYLETAVKANDGLLTNSSKRCIALESQLEALKTRHRSTLIQYKRQNKALIDAVEALTDALNDAQRSVASGLSDSATMFQSYATSVIEKLANRCVDEVIVMGEGELCEDGDSSDVDAAETAMRNARKRATVNRIMGSTSTTPSVQNVSSNKSMLSSSFGRASRVKLSSSFMNSRVKADLSSSMPALGLRDLLRKEGITPDKILSKTVENCDPSVAVSTSKSSSVPSIVEEPDSEANSAMTHQINSDSPLKPNVRNRVFGSNSNNTRLRTLSAGNSSGIDHDLADTITDAAPIHEQSYTPVTVDVLKTLEARLMKDEEERIALLGTVRSEYETKLGITEFKLHENIDSMKAFYEHRLANLTKLAADEIDMLRWRIVCLSKSGFRDSSVSGESEDRTTAYNLLLEVLKEREDLLKNADEDLCRMCHDVDVLSRDLEQARWVARRLQDSPSDNDFENDEDGQFNLTLRDFNMAALTAALGK